MNSMNGLADRASTLHGAGSGVVHQRVQFKRFCMVADVRVGPSRTGAYTRTAPMHGFSMHQPASRPWDGRPALPASKPVVKKEDASRSDQTELVVCLERRGEGWGEEILPHLHVERRPVSPAAKHWPVQSKEEDTVSTFGQAPRLGQCECMAALTI